MEKIKVNISDGSIDRLSALPDHIVCHILSFLPTKISVSTSVLSRRWKHMWAHVPSLDFDTNRRHDIKLATIKRFMSRYKVQSMNTFRLHVSKCCDSELKACLTAVIVRKVKNLDIYFGRDCSDTLMLPRVSTYEALVDLRLDACTVVVTAGEFRLPAVKKLYLGDVHYACDDYLPNLLSGCQVLEDLTIDGFGYHHSKANTASCYISSTTIKRLVLIDHEECVVQVPMLKIDTPALRYLQLHDFISNESVSAAALTCLIEVDIIFDSKWVKDADIYARSVFEFVDRLCNVKYLKLSSHWMMVPHSTFSAMIMKFHNLTTLDLAADWYFLSSFLENADNLEVLIVRKVNIDSQCWREPHQEPKCLLSHLKTIRIDQIGCTDNEFELIKYLLRNAKVLERIEVCSVCNDADSMVKLDALQIISSFDRGSDACELVLH